MSSLYHQKYHRHNHHTLPLSGDLHPDSSQDPIASYDSPFMGDFVLDGCLYSAGLNGTAKSVGVTLSSDNIALHAIGDVNIHGNVSVKDLTITSIQEESQFIVSTDAQYDLSLNTQKYDVKVWDLVNNVDVLLNYTAPSVIDIEQEEYVNNLNYISQSYINVVVTGTRPIYFQWYRNGKVLPGQNKSFIRTSDDGDYTLIAKNRVGEISVVVAVPFDEDVITNHKYVDLTTHDGYDLYIEYNYLVKIDNSEIDYIVDQYGTYLRV